MLGQLHIKNIGIIDDITMNFEDGLNIITGETGAGKSLIINSISAVTGSRLTKDMIKSGTESALIEACFFENDENIILRREFYSNGRNICKINGNMVTLSELKKVGESLIDIHGQHDNQSLLDTSSHLKLLDRFIGEDLSKIKSDYSELLHEYKEIKKELESNYGNEKDRARRIDLLNYQIEEIESANLVPDEEEELITKRKLIMNSEKIAKALSNVYSNLNDIVVDNLGMATHELSTIASLDSRYDKILLNLNEAYYMLKDSASDTLECMNSIDYDDREQEVIEERLDLIHNLKRKYGDSIEAILKYYDEIKIEIDKLVNSDEILRQLNIKLKNVENKLNELAIKIRNKRVEYSKIICQKVNKELQDLEMKNAYIDFEFKKLDDYNENGLDDVQIMISTNLGETPKPLAKIASGGEISRIMLALKVVFCKYDTVGSMVFDEIDTGISGQAAKVVAEKMKFISDDHQIICITHLPVIAAMGDTNYFISKNIQNSKTITCVNKLNDSETIYEIARMLDGNNISNITIKHAKALRLLKNNVISKKAV